MSNKPIVVTAGETWVDIDAFACAVAYTELLRLQGKESTVVIPGVLNATIPPALAAMGSYEKTPPHAEVDVVVVDVSDAAHFAKCVRTEDIVEIFDHHHGFEAFWSDKLGDASHIEMIGACATLIFEAWVRADKVAQMSETSAQLLAAAIASNTLNFQIDITCARDHHAFAECLRIGNVDAEWITDYFATCDQQILADIPTALRNDTKFGVDGMTIGQLELWHSGDIVREHQDVIAHTLAGQGPWFLNAPSIADRINYLLCDDEALKAKLSHAIGAVWSEHVGTTPKLMLRKEILRALHTA